MGEKILSYDRSYNNGLERGLLVGREAEPAAALVRLLSERFDIEPCSDFSAK